MLASTRKRRASDIPTSYDVIVIGAGSMGMSAGYHLTKQNVKTLLIDKFDPPHVSGSHHGDTRLIRHAYTGSPTYTAMARWFTQRSADGFTLNDAATAKRITGFCPICRADFAGKRTVPPRI